METRDRYDILNFQASQLIYELIVLQKIVLFIYFSPVVVESSVFTYHLDHACAGEDATLCLIFINYEYTFAAYAHATIPKISRNSLSTTESAQKGIFGSMRLFYIFRVIFHILHAI